MLRYLPTLTLALALFVPAISSAAPPTSSAPPAKESAAPTEQVHAVLKSLASAFDKDDPKAAAALFTENGNVISPYGVPGTGRAGVEKVIAADMAGPLRGTSNSFTTDSVDQLAPNLFLVDATQEAQNMTGPDGKKMTGKLHVVSVMVRGKDNKLMIAAARAYMFLPPPPQASARR